LTWSCLVAAGFVGRHKRGQRVGYAQHDQHCQE
jgi:hypothetical protein